MDFTNDHFTKEKPRTATSSSYIEKPKKFKDFLLIAEFSERIGPNTVLTIPEESVPETFDRNAFAIRVLSIDWHTKNFKNSKFSIHQDVRVMLSEPKENAHALVYYLTLHDSYARGNERHYCICYISQDQLKLLRFFIELNNNLSDIVSLIHTSNNKLFYRDQYHHYELLSNEKLRIEKEGLPKNIPPGITLVQALENLTSKLTDIIGIIEVLESVLRESNCESDIGDTNSIKLRMDSRSSLAPSESSSLQEEDKDDCASYSNLQATNYLSMLAITSSVSNFDRKLATLPHLMLGDEWKVIKLKLKKTVEIFGRDSCELLLDRYDAQCMAYSPSSLLTIGQYVVNNFLPPPEKKTRNSSSSNCNCSTRIRSFSSKTTKDMQIDNNHANRKKVTKRMKSDPSTVVVNDISHNNIYQLQQQQSLWQPIRPIKSISTQSTFSDYEASLESPGNEVFQTDTLKEGFDEINTQHTHKQVSQQDISTCDESSDSEIFFDIKSRGNSMRSIYTSYDEISLGDSDICDTERYGTPPEFKNKSPKWYEEKDEDICHDRILLYASSVPNFDDSENLKRTVPGASLYNQMFFTPNLVHAAYMLLSGNTVVCESWKSSAQYVRKFINNMSIFVPGSFASNQVKENYQMPICLSKLNQLKLVGVLLNDKNKKNSYSHIVEKNINKMRTTPQCAEYWGGMYDGYLLSRFSRESMASKDSNQILNSKFQFALLHSIFLKLAMKAFVVFHYSLVNKQIDGERNNFLKEELNLKDSDWIIVRYLVKLMRRQILETNTTNCNNLEDYFASHMSSQYKYTAPNVVVNYFSKEYSKANTLPATMKSSIMNK